MGTYTTPKPGDRLPFGSKRGASMTDAELQIIEFLMTSDATRPADLPDLLALLEGDRQEELSHELITVASLSCTSAACTRESASTPPGP